VAIQINIPLLSAEAQKKEESLDCFPPRFARGRNDGDRLSSQNALELRKNLRLEQFQRKWEPVSRPELRKNKEIERFRRFNLCRKCSRAIKSLFHVPACHISF